jgi:integral membrane sensor domain MASE1
MQILRNNAFMLIAVIFMLIGVVRAARGGEGVAVWIALGAVFIALGAAQMKKNKDGNDAG